MRAKDALGEYGERVARAHLEADGMQIVATRWRCARGEIDLVAVDGQCLVVCEVKTRRSAAAGSALEAVTPAKLARLRLLTGLYLAASHGDQPPGGPRHHDLRIDVVAVTVPRRGGPRVEHLRAVA